MTTEKSNETKGSIGRCIIQKEVVTLYNEEVKQKGHRADALALRAEERRDKLRKAAGRGTCPVIRRCLNGETRTGRTPCIHA